MPSVFDAVTGAVAGPDRARLLAGHSGLAVDGMERALRTVVPVVIAGIATRLGERGGPRAVLDLLDAEGGAALADVDRYLADGDLRPGTGMRHSLFGSDQERLLVTLTERSGTDPAAMDRLWSLVTPLVIGVLAEQRAARGLNAPQLLHRLTAERADLIRRGLLVPDPEPAGSHAGPGAIGRSRRVTTLDERRPARTVEGTGEDPAAGAEPSPRGQLLRRAAVGCALAALGLVAVLLGRLAGVLQL